MLLLNTTEPKEVTKLLFISIHLMLLLNGCGKTMVMTQIAYFNTSYVVIKHKFCCESYVIYINFNTSYVVIKQTATVMIQR